MIAAAESPVDAPAVVDGLRDAGLALREAGYSSDGLRAVLGVTGTDIPFTAADLVGYRRRLAAAGGPITAVVAVFCLGWTRPADELAAAIGRPALDALIAGRALVEGPDGVKAAVRILPHGELLVASDRRPGSGSPAGPLHVTGINAPATLLASLSVRQPEVRALDLGTGNGIQALLAASHADSVVATDVNPRALAFGAFNAALNGIDRIEFREGSWYEPVAGERFDLIVSNPPYVISPDNDLVYRDSGDEPGALCGRLIGDAPDHLTDRGFATFLASWPLNGGGAAGGAPDSAEPWWTVPASWIGPDGWAWLMMMRQEDPLTHASQWNLPLAVGHDGDDLADFSAAVRRWTDYLAERRISAVAYGAVVQQRRTGGGGVLRHDGVHAGSGSASRHILRVFAAAEHPADGAPPTAERTCTIPAEARLDGTFVPAETGWAQGTAVLRLAEGLGIHADLDPVMTDIVLAVTAGTRVDEAADAAAARMGLPDPERQELRSAAAAMVAELVGLGLLEFAAG